MDWGTKVWPFILKNNKNEDTGNIPGIVTVFHNLSQSQTPIKPVWKKNNSSGCQLDTPLLHIQWFYRGLSPVHRYRGSKYIVDKSSVHHRTHIHHSISTQFNTWGQFKRFQLTLRCSERKKTPYTHRTCTFHTKKDLSNQESNLGSMLFICLIVLA